MTHKADPKTIIVNILDIAGYGDGKIDFANQLIQLCHQQALVDLKKKNFTEGEYLEAIQKATQKLGFDYIKEITPKLSADQLDNLQKYIKSLT